MCLGHRVCRGPEVGVAGVRCEGGGCLPGMSGALLAPPPLRALVISLPLRLIHGLEGSLLNASFQGCNLTFQTSTIQTLAFKLGCDFAGLSLDSEALRPVPQVRGNQGVGVGVSGASTPEIF